MRLWRCRAIRVAVAAGLLLAGAVGEAFDARVGEVSACLPRITALIKELLERVEEWDSFVKAGSPIYFLGRGDSYASVLEGALLIGETAKEAAVGLAAASFRHGPVEIVDENFRAVIFAGPAGTRGLNLELARELAKFGGKIRVIGGGGDDAGGIVVDCDSGGGGCDVAVDGDLGGTDCGHAVCVCEGIGDWEVPAYGAGYEG